MAKNKVKVTYADGTVEFRSAGSFQKKNSGRANRRRVSKAERQAMAGHRRLNYEMERAAARDE